MGNCNSQSITNPVQIQQTNISQHLHILSKKANTSQQAKTISNSILTKFCIGKQLFHILNGVSFTQNQAKDLAKALLKGVISLQKPESKEDKEQVNALFNETNIQMILDEQLFYYGMVDKLKKTNISQSSKSRIYHNIANINKEYEFDQKQKNEWGVEYIVSNGYNKLSESELQQVVNYESIAGKTKQIGQKLGLKLQSIKKQSQKMTHLLVECMQKHAEAISQMKYDLNNSEVMKVAEISRQACNHYDNGVYVLLVYLVQSCKRLQQQSKSIQEIQALLFKAIDDISKKYPPGQGLSKENEGLIKTLRDLQNPANYRQVNFTHQEIKLTSSNKQLQVEEIITKYARIAEQCKQLFEELVKATCLAKCVYFKIGLKYYPNNPNKKALTRIKEKMFFKKDAKQSGKKINGANIKEILDKEQTAYRSIIDQILKTTDKVQFKISDMVRGKCVFLQVGDIIQSVNEIKEFAANNPKFGIKQIESRFTNAMPISDVTLKIVLDNQIVAQLQLTIQTNAATYNFAHKIYQLQRSKVFSKLKITHNYFQESKDEFSELARKAIELQAPKLATTLPIRNIINQYFKLDFQSKPFGLILEETIQENKKQVKQLTVSVDPLLQDLILVSFKISIGIWGKQIGNALNKALKDENLSPKLKSVALSIFLGKIYLPNESQYMQQLCILGQQLDKKIYIQEYIKQFYQIQNILRYAKQNSRVFYRAEQLQKIIFYKGQQYYQVKLMDTIFIENLVIEYQCIQKIKSLKEILSFYFITRTENNKFYAMFQKYSKWIQDQFSKDNNSQETELLKNEIEIIKAEYQLEKGNTKEASQCLQRSRLVFKSREKYSKAMECQILLAQCSVKTSNYQLFSKYADSYNANVIQKAQILGEQLKGVLYADSLWRISEYLFEKIKTNQIPQLLKYFTAMAISQLSRCRGKQFVYALKSKWNQYDKLGLDKPQIKANPNIKYAKLRDLQPEGIYCLSKADWKNITRLHLHGNNVRNEGCQYLSKADWRNITTLDLCIMFINGAGNDIRAAGCQQLSKANWKNITILNLSGNYVADEGCQYLSKADWKNITILGLKNNEIEDKGCQHLSKANWKNIKQLDLTSNNIGAAGCYHLSKADWKNITALNLNNNGIQDLGCQHLSKADWKNITYLNLSDGNIGPVGCQYLRQANWKNITKLSLTDNIIGDAGCQHLSKADWKNITTLDFSKNIIGAAGCQYLSKAGWKNITILGLFCSKIGAAGCQHLSKANWKNLSVLGLFGNDIGDAGCQHLSRANWKNITQLSLQENKIGDAGCQHLSKGDWKTLTTLNLSYNSIGDAGCQHLSKTNWTALNNLDLIHNNISQQSKKKLRSIWNEQTTIYC